MSFYLHESTDDIAMLLTDNGQVIAIFPSLTEAEDALFELNELTQSEQQNFNDAA